MSNQRDELAAEIADVYLSNMGAGPLAGKVTQFDLAEAILAAGYRKPRTISEDTRVSMVDTVLAYKGTPRHKLFEYPHRDDHSRMMIRDAEGLVTVLLAVLHEPTS